MEPISLALGATVAKWAFRLWLDDSAFKDLSVDLTDLVRGRFPDIMAGRRAGREFERLADLMAERLAPYVENEFRDLDSSERNAAADAVNKALTDALSASLDPIKFDLDAAALEGAINAEVPNAAENAYLSAGATSLYNLLLSESCGYIVTATSKLPEFSSQASKELLARTSRLTDMVAEALDRLPRTVPESWGIGSEDDIFTSKYLRSVVQKNDKLQIFGVSNASYRASYSLSVAYLSLTSTIPVPGMIKPSDVVADSIESDPAYDGEPGVPEDTSNALRVEATLSAADRLLLGGNAGSGKTTLLQWIAVTTSQSGFGDEMADWNGSIPFVLPLRRFASTEMPAPEKFVEVSHRNLAGAMPQGWVHKVLADGQAIVLVDGLDELPDSRRSQARQWLVELMDDFPDSRYIVTSRPLAISPDWGSLPGFKYSELLPMDRADVRAFVSHWHRAAAALTDNVEEQQEIDEAEQRLISSIASLPHIAMLSTSPLLCALICAMHKQNANKLPENRMELYETALQMLVSSRDSERDVNLDAYPDLSYAERKALLADFALWLHESGASDTDEAHLYRRVGIKLRSLPRRSDTDSVEVGRFLLARSGVLRVPIEGRVDFVHRTFLEYLAAAALVDDEAVDKIVAHAHLDQWREVVVMAAGHFTAKSREQFLVGLINRGREEAKHQHRLFLLAVACLETSPVLSRTVQELLDGCLDEIMPPENMGDALAIASAGNLAVPRLTGKWLRATEAAAAIRALSLIATEEAFEALRYYATDNRVTVTRELIRAWGQFDSERYAKELLAHSSLDGGHVTITDPELIHLLGEFGGLKSALLDVAGKFSGFDSLDGSEFVTALNIERSHGMRDLTGIDRFPNLRVVVAGDSKHLRSVKGISACPDLSMISLNRCPRLSDISEVSEFSEIRQLQVASTGVRNLAPLQNVSIRSLRVGGALESIGANQMVSRLQLFYSPDLVDIQAISDWEDLEEAYFVLTDVEIGGSLVLPPSLSDLHLNSAHPDSVTLGGGEGLDVLRTNVRVDFESPLHGVTELHATLEAFRAMRSAGHFAGELLPQLSEVWLVGRGVEDIAMSGFARRRISGNPPTIAIFDRQE